MKRWWEELVTKGELSPSSRCTAIVALCRSRALPEALTALTEMSNILSANSSFHLLPGKRSRPPRSETESDTREELSSSQSERRSEPHTGHDIPGIVHLCSAGIALGLVSLIGEKKGCIVFAQEKLFLLCRY